MTDKKERIVPISELLHGKQDAPTSASPVTTETPEAAKVEAPAQTVEAPAAESQATPEMPAAAPQVEAAAEEAPAPFLPKHPAAASESAASAPEPASSEGAAANTSGKDAQLAFENEAQPVVLMKGLSKKIGSTEVLRNLDLALLEGHVLGMLGPNGAGKTTLLRILAGLVHPTAGRVEIDGIPVGLKTKAIVSFLPDTVFLSTDITVERARKYFETYFADFDTARFDALAERLKLPKRTRLSKMSKGYRDRLAVSLAMSRRARLYLLDEPLGGVDPVVRDEILDILVEAMVEQATMIITTHQVRDMERIFDEVCFLKEGQIAEYGPAETLRAQSGLSMDAMYKQIFG